MSSSDSDTDNEDYFANLDSSDSSASDSDEELSLSKDEGDGDELLRGARQWYPLPVGDNLRPPPPPFSFIAAPGLSITANVSEINPLDFFSLFLVMS